MSHLQLNYIFSVLNLDGNLQQIYEFWRETREVCIKPERSVLCDIDFSSINQKDDPFTIRTWDYEVKKKTPTVLYPPTVSQLWQMSK